MAKVRLTDKYVTAITAPKGERLEVFDQHPLGAGLMLRVTDAGKKTWMVRYRTDDGQHRRLSLGMYPEIDLAEARVRAGAARKEANDGNDPAGAKKVKRAEAKAQTVKTFADLAEVYFTACEIGEWKPRGKKKRDSTLANERWLWNKHIKPKLGDLRVEEVSPNAVKAVLRALVAAGNEVTSNRVRAQIRQMFNFAISEKRLTSNPIDGIQALGEEKPRDRVIRDEELQAVWSALSSPTSLRKPPSDTSSEGERVYVSQGVATAIKLLSLLLTRRAEVAGMERDELVVENTTQPSWTIPGARTKNGQPHFVPLSETAADLIRDAMKHADDGHENPSRFVFPSPRNRQKPITPAAISHALRDVRMALGLKRLSPHDLRRTAATNMASERLRISPFLIGRLLNHTSETGGAAMVTMTTYALHDYAPEKRQALAAWEELLLTITEQAAGDLKEAV